MALELLRDYLILSAVLFSLGAAGFLARRNMIVMFLSAEMMLQGVSLALVAFGRAWGNWHGQVFTIFVLTVAAAEAGIALALVLVLFRRRGSLDISLWQDLREPDQPATIDEPEPGPAESELATPYWPQLAPAGLEPAPSTPETRETTHVG
jgi:NADH-quinone oxidoreductase subunit K